MAYEYFDPRGNPKRTKSDHQKQQFIVPPVVYSSGQFPPGFFPYEYVPFSQPSWQGNANIQGGYHPQILPTNNLYAPAWNGYYAQPLGPPSLTPYVSQKKNRTLHF